MVEVKLPISRQPPRIRQRGGISCWVKPFNFCSFQPANSGTGIAKKPYRGEER